MNTDYMIRMTTGTGEQFYWTGKSRSWTRDVRGAYKYASREAVEAAISRKMAWRGNRRVGYVTVEDVRAGA